MPQMSLLIKPASGTCNMRCKYCFYADEQKKRDTASYGMMSRGTIHIVVDQAMDFAEDFCTMAFQGGEPMLAGIDFFGELTDYIKRHPNPKRIRFLYALQTNAYLLNEEWAQFFAEHHFLVGVSLDGTKEVHDRYRVDAQGKGSYHKVMGAIRLLEKYHVDYNILTVVTAAAARNAQRTYHFFKKNNIKYQQYIECLDPIGEEPGKQEYSLTPKRYERFLKDLFDVWYLDWKAGTPTYNRYFENLLLILNRRQPESCNMRGICGNQWVVEADGSVYPCDFYALDKWKLGNVHTDSFEAMDAKREQLGFVEWSRQTPPECKACRWYVLCRNGCRRLREPVTEHTTRVNYFCSAYKGFFEYAYPRLMEICQNLIR